MLSSHGRASFLALLLSLAAVAQVRVSTGTLTLPTYQETAPDPNPPFPIFSPDSPRYYPYTTRNGYTTKLTKVTWRTVELENEYLRCTILPDLGGRIYGCADRISRHDLFYTNPVIKKSPVGLRGAWAAAGTEFNFPIGHSWTTVSPVNFSTRQNPDGSASVFVSDTNLVDGMRWQVEILLRPGVAVVEQRITLNNPTPIRRGYYWWNNAAITAYEDTRFTLPCHLTSGHGQADVEPWPVSQGIDFSLLANHKLNGLARFAIACKEPFMGVYSAREATGTAHYADPSAVPGKKLWSWGAGQFGLEASKTYTDDGSQYVELQAGVFRDQETFGFLNPGELKRFTEYWMPIHAIGGISRVTPSAAVFMTRAGSQVQVNFQVYRPLPNATIEVAYSDHTVLAEKLTLDPAKVEKRTIPNAKPGVTYRFELRDQHGEVLLAHTENFYDALTAITPVQETRDPGWVAESEGNLLLALQQYGTKNPLATGRVLLALNRFDEALQALLRAPTSPEAHHYLGLAYHYSGNDEKARAEWSAAPHDKLFGHPRGKFEVPALEHNLSTDASHFLHEAALLMEGGRYKEALELLSYKSPEVPPEQREPGVPMPQDHPLISYYRGYCRLKMGQSPKEDFALAARQSPQYVFPNEPGMAQILRAAIAANPNDANAHYLIGSFFLAGGAIDSTIQEWQLAVKLNSTAPGLHASLGRLQRDFRKDTEAAVQTFRAGIKVDPHNAVIQNSVKLDPAKPDEIAALALTMLESGRLADAAALFTETNFPKERQSDLVRTAFIEARLRTIQDMAQRKRCPEALAWVDTIGDEAPGVPFSLYGFANVLKTPRVQYTLGNIQSTCGEAKAAKKFWTKAAKSAGASAVDSAYAEMAAATLEANESKQTAALANLRKALGQPTDPMLRYLSQILP